MVCCVELKAYLKTELFKYLQVNFVLTSPERPNRTVTDQGGKMINELRPMIGQDCQYVFLENEPNWVFFLRAIRR